MIKSPFQIKKSYANIIKRSVTDNLEKSQLLTHKIGLFTA